MTLRPFRDTVTIRHANGRTLEVTITDVIGRNHYYAEVDDQSFDPHSFELHPDGSITKARWGQGRNAGEVLWTKDIAGRWSIEEEVTVSA